PHYFLSSSANYTARWSGGIASDRLGALNALTTENVPNAPGEGVQLLNLDNGSYANDLLIAAPLADTNSKADAGALYMVLNIDSRMGNFDMNTPSSYDARFSGSRAGDMLTYPTQVGKGFQVFDADGDGSTNDLLVVAGSATFTGANAGSLYFIQDIHSKSGLLDLNNLNNFTARWDGLSNSRLGWTGYSGDAFDVYDVDADGILDDLVLSLPFGDTQSRTDNGALYLINNVTSRSGINPLSSSSSYTVAYHGATASDKIGGDLNGGLGYQIVNMDGNASANDVVLVAPFADLLQGFFFILNDNGGVYIIPDFNTRTGDVDLSSVFFPLFNGKLDNDNVGYSNDSNLTAQIVNTDGNANANDLLITCILCDNSRTDNGSIHLFKDAHLRTAATDLTTSDVYWTPMVNLDQFGYTAGGGLGAQVVNLDGNVAANDMIVTCARCNTASILENGTVYIFRDINTLSGAKALSVSSNYYLRFYGATNYDRIGDIGKSGQSVQLVNTDGNALANDLVFGSRAVTTSPGITGAVYFVRDLLSFSGSLTLATSSNYTARWSPPSVDDNFGYTNNSGPGIQIVNLDNGIATNDLIVTAVRADINSKTNAGGVWVMKDINTLSGQIILDTDANYSVRFNGGKTEDYLGYTIQGGQGTWMVNLDNNAYSNDLVLAAASADTTLQDAGSVYIIQDVDFKSGNIDLDTNTNYLKRYSGGDANLFLGSTQYGGSGLRLLDSDGDSFLDLFLTSVQADINGKPQSGVLYRIEDVYRFLDVGLDYSFTLSLPADGCTDGKGNFSGGTSCQRGWVGATSDTQTQVQPEGQDVDNTISFFVLDNQSTTSSDFNVFLDLNAALPGTIVFKASNSKSGYQSTCSGNPANNCVTLSTTKKSVGTAIYSAGTQDLNIFFWADFTSAPDGNVDRNVGSTAQSP
ncbi:MAG: hypothetical protein U1C71_05070, partial [archaeon]|nr:hypothetical protein [archaeon]